MLQGIATIPKFFWELSLGIYLIVKGSGRLRSFPQRGSSRNRHGFVPGVGKTLGSYYGGLMGNAALVLGGFGSPVRL